MKKRFQLFCIINIFFITISLLGLTYGYLSVKILGNSGSKLMSFTSKKVRVTYKEISNTSSGETISPGYEYLKIFTATNTGNVEVKYHIYLDEVENDFIRVEDITYTLYRKSGNNTITSSNLSSAEVIASGTFPIVNQYIKTDEVLTKPNDVYTYALKINYNTSTESQDSDSGHIFGFKVQLHTNKDETYGENTLAYNVIKNAIGETDTEEQSGTAKYRPTPTTNVATSISNNTEADLSQTVDDYGKTFYFRGNVKNNYVNFAGMCWRIVRILGDGSVKLILEDQDGTCSTSDGNWNIPSTTNGTTKTGSFGYKIYSIGELVSSAGTTNNRSKTLLNYLNGYNMVDFFINFQTGPLANYLDKLKPGDWCLNDKAYATTNDNTTALTSQEMLDKQINSLTLYYDSYVRLIGKTIKEPTLKCNGTNMNKFANNSNMNVGTITADEIVYAGATIGETTNYNIYLVNTYQNDKKLYFWTLSPATYNKDYDYVYLFNAYGYITDYSVGAQASIRPAIILKSEISINNGIGTKTNPYVIN